MKTLATGLLCLVATAALAQEADPTVAPTAPLAPAVPVVQLGNSDHAFCTAFYIGSAGTPSAATLLVSAGHCYFETGVGQADFKVLPAGSSPKVKGPGGLLAAAFVAGANVDSGFDDWAVFRLAAAPPAGWKPAVLDCAYVAKTGDALTSLGYPVANGGLTAMQGFVNGPPRPVDGMFPVIPVTMAVSGGASGSPVFEADGRVVGILVATNTEQPAWAYVEPITPVCQALHIKV